MAEVDAAEAFGRAQRIGMRMAAVIEPTAFLEARGLDDEGVAFPPADRVAVPRGLSEISQQLPPVGMNLPVLVELLEQKKRNAWHLQDLPGDSRNCHRIRHPVGHAVRFGAVPAERL